MYEALLSAIPSKTLSAMLATIMKQIYLFIYFWNTYFFPLLETTVFNVRTIIIHHGKPHDAVRHLSTLLASVIIYFIQGFW